MNVIGVNKEGTCPFKGTAQVSISCSLKARFFLHKRYIFEEYNERGSGSVNLLFRI